jgi:GTP-binding protein Era
MENNNSPKFGSVALIGRPNAGKSTLVNRLVGEKIAIVTDKPQTTRTRIMGIVTEPGWQMVIFDAPGIHRPKDRLGRAMVDAALGGLPGADVIYYIVDAATEFGAGEAYILQILKKTKTPVFLLLNKVDLLVKDTLLPLIASWSERGSFAHIFPLSALEGDNVRELLEATVECFQDGPARYDEDEMTDQTERAMVEEMVREKAILATRQEVPYAVAVFIESMEERREGLMDIHGVIVVEQDSQKGILIGKNGSVLKWIGSESRRDIEALLGAHVNLQLRVQARANWRNNEQQLRRFAN